MGKAAQRMVRRVGGRFKLGAEGVINGLLLVALVIALSWKHSGRECTEEECKE